MEPIQTFAIALDATYDKKNNQQHFLTISDVESYYNIQTVNESFDIKTSYLAIDGNVLFSLSNTKHSIKSNFKYLKEITVESEPVSLRSLVKPTLSLHLYFQMLSLSSLSIWSLYVFNLLVLTCAYF